jgi:hypothetical protein
MEGEKKEKTNMLLGLAQMSQGRTLLEEVRRKQG